MKNGTKTAILLGLIGAGAGAAVAIYKREEIGEAIEGAKRRINKTNEEFMKYIKDKNKREIRMVETI